MVNGGTEKYVVSAGCSRGRFRGRERLGANQMEPRKAHGLHGPRHCADVTGVRGLDQDDSNGVKFIVTSHVLTWVRGADAAHLSKGDEDYRLDPLLFQKRS